jgi:N-acetylneuraminic acid mutarotase
MPNPRFETTPVSLDGYIYVMGGITATHSLKSVTRYDPATDTWQEMASMPDFRNHIGIATLNGKIYLSGGIYGEFSFDGQGKTFWVYDPQTDQWSSMPDMPIGRAAHGMAVLGGKFYLVGGIVPPAGDSSEIWVYDPATETWDTTRAHLPTPRDHLIVTAYDGKLYAIGGRYSGNLSTVEIYDPATDSWTRGPDMPTPRSGMGYAILEGQLHTIAGEDVDRGLVYMKHEVLDFETLTWTKLPDIPWPLNAPIVAELDQRIFVMGGASARGYPYEDVWTFTP